MVKSAWATFNETRPDPDAEPTHFLAMDRYECPRGCRHQTGEKVAAFRGPDEEHPEGRPKCWKCGRMMCLTRSARTSEEMPSE